MNRKIYMDVLKILACFAVILQHSVNVTSEIHELWNWHYMFSYTGRFAVPIFVMVTGALLLDEDKTITVKQIIMKYIPRVLLPLIGIVYIIQVTDMMLTGTYTWKVIYRPIVSVLTNNVSVPYWYIYMLIGLYLMLPFIKKIISGASKREIEYFLVLFLGIRTVVPFWEKVLETNLFSKVTNAFMINIVSGYVGFLVLGYYLNKYINIYRVSWIIWIDIFVVIAPLFYIVYVSQEKYTDGIYFADIFSINMVVHAVCLFLIAKSLCNYIPNKIHSSVVRVSSMTFYMYLLHVYMLQMFNVIGIRNYDWGKLDVPIRAILNFIACLVVVYILEVVRKIKWREKLWRRTK